MDPNATLARLRELAADGTHLTMTETEEMAELFEALDAWMSKGGFMPSDWSWGR